MQGVSVETVERSETLERYVSAWDALAVDAGLPLIAPAWSLAWWRHVRPRRAALRTVVVTDHRGLLGLGPYFAQHSEHGRADYRLLGVELSQRIAPLARRGHEGTVAAAIGDALRRACPRPDVVSFEAVSAASTWPGLIGRHLGGPAAARRHMTAAHAAPTVSLAGHTPESWLASHSSNFRQQMRRLRRKLERSGGGVRLVGPGEEEIAAAVAALGRLHRARWQARGHPGIIDDRVEAMLRVAGRDMAGTGRFRLWTVELEGEPIGAQLFVEAGGEVAYWNGGWDERHADLKPGMLGIHAAIEHAIERGDRRMDLAGGAQPYKLRFADADDPLAWMVVAPLKRRYPRTRVEFLPQQARWRARGAFRRLPDRAQAQIKLLVGRR